MAIITRKNMLVLGIIILILLFVSGSLFAREQRTNHFNPVWSGNGLQHMNFFVMNASIDDIPLVQDDEIAVYDGLLCVGMVKLTAPINQYISFVVSLDDPTTTLIDGYTVSHTISFKIWKSSTQQEYIEPELLVNYVNANNSFVIGGTSIVSISNTISTNIVSASVLPVNSGTVSGLGTYPIGFPVVLTAIANANYTFLKWTDIDGNTLSSEQSYQFQMPASNVNVSAVFLPDEHPRQLNYEVNNAQVKLIWQKPFRLESSNQDFLGYMIYRNNGSLSPTLVTDTVFFDNSVSEDVVYTYHISAFYQNPNHESSPSNSVEVLSNVETVSDINGINSLSRNIISWIAPSNEAGRLGYFQVYRNNIFLNNVDITSYYDYEIENGVTYSYKVKAVYLEPFTFSELSDSVSVNSVLNPPRNLSAIPSINYIRLNWERPLLPDRSFAGYFVYRNGILQNIQLVTDTLYIDYAVSPNTDYTYFVTADYFNPESESNPSNSVVTQTLSQNENSVVLNEDKLIGNYPNPFNPDTNISYNLKEDAYVKIEIYNIKGELVKSLYKGFQKKGINILNWKAKDNALKDISSGVYFCRMSTKSFSQTKKMFLLK